MRNSHGDSKEPRLSEARTTGRRPRKLAAIDKGLRDVKAGQVVAAKPVREMLNPRFATK
jgi:hypothetical protein